MCVWLGTLASWRPGLIGALVREHRTIAGVLARRPADIAAFAARRPARGRRRAGGIGEDGAPAEQATDAARFEAALQAGPAACLRQAERRPPGDLVVAWSESLYPDQLRDLPDPPLCLFGRGGSDPDSVRARLSALVDTPLVAVVGTRSPSPYGEEMARGIAGDLTRAGVVVVSGMALGVDSVAQTAAVDAGVGTVPSTVAVLGCGADVVYPRRNARLYARITCGGLVLSEFVWGVPARAWRFPARNRIMAALVRGVVFVEGTHRSGGRITVTHAADIGRDVLCVPGEAGRRLSEAPNGLLRQGAKVCEGAGDVLAAIGVRGAGEGGAPPFVAPDHGGAAVRDVLAALREASLTIDELARRCGLPVAKAAAAVSDLEIEGLTRRVDGGRYLLLRR